MRIACVGRCLLENGLKRVRYKCRNSHQKRALSFHLGTKISGEKLWVLRTIHSRHKSTKSEWFDPYEVLNVEPGSSAKDIKNAYIKLSKKYHPDFNPGDEVSNEKFVQITNAYRRIIERLEKEEENKDDMDDNNHPKEKEYDFTISPLGIETEPIEERRWLSIRNIILVLGFGAAFFYYKNYIEYGLFSTLEDFIQREKTEEEYIAEVKKKIRESVAEEHKKQQGLEESMSKMKQAALWTRK